MAPLFENEFEQRLAVALKLLLPSFSETEITSQRSFRLKFGHYERPVEDETTRDDKRKYSKGTYDVLLSIKGKPLIMLELKKPGISLELPKDRDQGISYARLTDPITPVTIITNGTDFKVFDTFTKSDISATILDEQFFIQRINQISNLSQNDFREAITTLIEGDQTILFELFNRISQDAFDRLTGQFNDVTKPIVKEFSVPRDLLEKVDDLLNEKQFIALTGDAYVGKTNFLYQFFKKKQDAGEVVLYLNCLDFHYSVFRKLTNHLHNLLRFPIDELKLKDWLLLQFSKDSAKKLTVVFDHLRQTNDTALLMDISELVDMFRLNGCQMIIATDHANFEQLKSNTDRVMNTMIGDFFYETSLEKFSTDEYNAANQLAYDNYQMTLAWGAVYSEIYRAPRIWRILLVSLVGKGPSGFYGLLKSVPGVEFLQIFRNGWQLGKELVVDFIKLIDPYIDGLRDLQNGRLKLITQSLGIIKEDKALYALGEQKLNRLIYAGYLERRLIAGFSWVLVPKLPELLAGHSRQKIYDRYLPLLKKDKLTGYRQFIEECEFFPYGDLVACRFVMDLAKNDEIDLFSDIANLLLDDEPKSEKTTDEKSVAIYVQKIGQVIMNFEEGVESTFLGNGFPWLILSQLLCMNIGDDSDAPHRFRLSLIAALANQDFMIRPADKTFFHEGIPSFEIGRLGTVLQTNIGIIEPITQALYFNLLNFPELFNEYTAWAKDNNMFQLLHRVYIAARNGVTMQTTDERSDPVCRKIIADYEYHLPEILAFGMAENENDEQEVKSLTARLRKLKNR